MSLRNLLFSPQCLGCGGALGARSAFCFTCTRAFLRRQPLDGMLLEHRGPGKAFVYALRSAAPHRAAAWAMALLERQGQLERWRGSGLDLVLAAPQNPRETSGLALLAAEIARAIGAAFLPRAFRKSGGRTQHRKSLVQRMDTRCFVELSCPEGKVRGRQLLVIDDVHTTGTTLDLCAYVLRRAGACRVWRFALARQVVPGLERKDH
jgi:predicted amidophosphoribosyltransferase